MLIPIAILGLLVLYLALQNFRMKATDIKGKDSFYTAEQALKEKTVRRMMAVLLILSGVSLTLQNM